MKSTSLESSSISNRLTLAGLGAMLLWFTPFASGAAETTPVTTRQERKAVLEAKLREHALAAENKPADEATKTAWANRSGPALVSAFCRLLGLQPTIPIAQPSFRDEAALAAGDPKKMSRHQLEQAHRDVMQASLKDEGLAMELQVLPADQREAAVAKLREKWAARRGENLRSEYYAAMAAYLRHRGAESRAKNSGSLGLADLTLLEGPDPATLGRDDLHDFHESVGRAAGADKALLEPRP